MSRPFSYSDENFTVIGNVLFCHIKISKTILENEPIIEIPQAIYSHMLFTTQTFVNVLSQIGTHECHFVDVGVNELEDKKYFLFCNSYINAIGSYIVGFFILKDI